MAQRLLDDYHQDRYESEKIEANSPHEGAQGLFSTVAVRNFLHNQQHIVVITAAGDRARVAPSISNANYSKLVRIRAFCDTIYESAYHDPRKTIAASKKPPVAKAMLEFRIKHDELEKGPVYLKELDWLICLEEQAEDARHPNEKSVLSKYLELVQTEVMERLINAPYTVVANDPTGQVPHLTMIVNGNPMTIKVAHLPREKPACVICYRDVPGGSLRYLRLNMEKIMEGECSQLEPETDNTVYIGIQRDNVLTAYRMAGLKQTITPTDLKDLTTSIEADLNRKFAAREDELRTEVKKARAETEKLRDQLEQERQAATAAKLKAATHETEHKVAMSRLDHENEILRREAKFREEIIKQQEEALARLRKEKEDREAREKEKKNQDLQTWTLASKIVAVVVPLVVTVINIASKWV